MNYLLTYATQKLPHAHSSTVLMFKVAVSCCTEAVLRVFNQQIQSKYNSTRESQRSKSTENIKPIRLDFCFQCLHANDTWELGLPIGMNVCTICVCLSLEVSSEKKLANSPAVGV